MRIKLIANAGELTSSQWQRPIDELELACFGMNYGARDASHWWGAFDAGELVAYAPSRSMPSFAAYFYRRAAWQSEPAAMGCSEG